MKPVLFFIALILPAYKIIAQKNSNNESITIIVQVPLGYTKDSIELTFAPIGSVVVGFSYEEFQQERQDIKQPVIHGIAKWKYNASEPLGIWSSSIKNSYYEGMIIEPGDSIYITIHSANFIFSGRGHEKAQLSYRLEQLNDSIDKQPAYKDLSHRSDKTASLNDYLQWIRLLDHKEKHILTLIESYKSKLSTFAYYSIKEAFLNRMEVTRVAKFRTLCGKAQQQKNTGIPEKIANQFDLTNEDLVAIYDSTLNGPVAKWLEQEAQIVEDPFYLLLKLPLDVSRQKKTFIKEEKSDSTSSGITGWVFAYNTAKKKYTGVIRESFLAHIFWYVRGVLYHYGFVPEVENMLADYYTQSKYPKYSEGVKRIELKYRERYSRTYASDFVLTDINGKDFSKEKIKGKIAVLDFWFSGCTGCIQMTPALQKVEEYFRNDTNVVFLSISIDENKDRWMKSIAQAKYTTGSGINLYTGGKGSSHEIISKYGVTGYPTLYLIDAVDRVTWATKIPDPRKDNGEKLIALIKQQLTFMQDGPYVFNTGKSIGAYAVNSGVVVNTQWGKAVTPVLQVQTDQLNRKFSIVLQPSLNHPSSDYSHPGKMLVLSDIEGNFEALRKLLQSNKVIDDNFNWTYDSGHLVFAGDMFDRGQQVTECLWLIYSLEEKAKKAGGYVHFILGNHEVMNLQGYHQYVQPKYKNNTLLIGKSLTELYGENSELGKWLRTKNIAEKIGDILFIHGGISRRLNNTGLTIAEINEIARPNYSNPLSPKSPDSLINLLFSDETSPFWYRSYYTDDSDKQKTMKGIIDSTLLKFSVNHIVTGHTIVADTISIHYDGKVINTDTKHAEGKSEALLIEGDHFYRVNDRGERVLLFVDRRK